MAAQLATYTILVNGDPLGQEIGIRSFYVVKSVNKIPTAQIAINDGSRVLGDFELSAGELFLPGNEVEIQAGYNGTEETIFKGIIIKHNIRAKTDEPFQLIIDLKDISIKTTVGRKNKYFSESKDSDIIEEILGDYSDIENDIEATELEHHELVQYFATDWDFIVSRADVNGKLVFVDDGKITVKEPDFDQIPKRELFNTTNGDILEFQGGMDARDQYSASKSISWDYAKQEVIEGEGTAPSFQEQGDFSASDLSDVIRLEEFPLQHTGGVIDQELKAWSDAKLLRSRMAKIIGQVKILGTSELKPGDIIELGGLGTRFNGNAFVSSVLHQVSPNKRWYTHIEFGLSQDWFARRYEDIIDEPAAGLVPAIEGLQIGIVTNIHEDPDGEDRVKVRLPIIDAENEGVWARVSTLDAGDSRGSFFRPELTDEVIVGFLNNDPRDAVILGMVHSSAKPSPITADEDNTQKGFVSREDMRLIFDDDLISLTIETPNGNKIVLSDDEGSIVMTDENDNIIEMTSDGINIESAGDITITAGGDVTVEGTNVTSTASSQLLVEGSSGAELSSAGQAVIKGATVGIN